MGEWYKYGERIGIARAKKKYTQDEVADGVGVTRSLYKLWENGTRRVQIEHLANLAKFLDVTIEYLLCESHAMTRNKSIQAIHKNTGLSETAINVLQMVTGYETTAIRNLINALLEYEHIGELSRKYILHEHTKVGVNDISLSEQILAEIIINYKITNTQDIDNIQLIASNAEQDEALALFELQNAFYDFYK